MSGNTGQDPKRKRPAPGAWPQTLPQGMQNTGASRVSGVRASDMSDDQFLNWGAAGALNNANELQRFGVPNAFTGGNVQSGNLASNQLVRRMNNTQLDGAGFGEAQLQRLDNRISPAVADESDDDEIDLDARAQDAKREAATRRPPRQIPPFIQKLSSFLDDPKNHDLIRWASDGKSFVVLDEDRFANELIPEMFKHNNYASFVRQLNMYGFHKKVGLADNSMRASEKKAKLPSGYRHKYFRRGRPDLLWLIEKPKPGNLTSKKKSGKSEHKDGDSGSPEQETGGASGQIQDGNTDLVTLSRQDLAQYRNLQQEVKDLQKSQNHIYSILKSMRDENKQYIKQAGAMLANHERHESSINAILQFLATFYNQSLQNGGSNMFPGAVPDFQQQTSVVEDMGDYTDSPPNYNTNSPQQALQRRRLLMPAPPTSDQHDVSTSQSPTVKAEQSPILPGVGNRVSSVGSSAQPTPGPDQRRRTPKSGQNHGRDIMNVINRSNAQQQAAQPTPYDLSTLQQYSQNANGNQGPLSPEQRDAMLAIMANNSRGNTPGIPGAVSSNNPSPYLEYFQNNQEQLDLLHRLQQEQEGRVADLAGRLQPLSPSGSIPGLEQMAGSDPDQSQMMSGQYNPQSDGFDFDNYLNDDLLEGGDASQPNFDASGDLGFDWNDLGGDSQNINTADSLFGETPGASGQDLGDQEGTGGGRIMGSVGSSSGAPTPRAPSVQDDDDGAADDSHHAGKKRKR